MAAPLPITVLENATVILAALLYSTDYPKHLMTFYMIIKGYIALVMIATRPNKLMLARLALPTCHYTTDVTKVRACTLLGS